MQDRVRGQQLFSLKSVLLASLQVLASAAQTTAIDEPTATATTTIYIAATKIFYYPSISTLKPIDHPDRWMIPLVGLSDDTSLPWGANVTTNNSTATPYTISIEGSDKDDSRKTQNHATIWNQTLHNFTDVQFIGDLEGNHVNLSIPQSDRNVLNLGTNHNLSLAVKGSNADIRIPTVPFGLNIGHAGEWNGSLALGGFYDANRLTDDATSWISIAETMNNNSTFLTTGKQILSAVILRVWQYNPRTSNSTTRVKRSGPFSVSDESEPRADYPARLDLSSDALVLPRDWCGRNLTLEFNMFPNRVKSLSSSILIGIPGNLTDSPSRCRFENNTQEIVLGRPFFQSTYLYVDQSGEVRILPANQYNLPPKPVEFNASARPVAPDRRTSRYSPGAAGGTLVKDSAGDRMLPVETAVNGALAGLLILAGFAFLL